MNYNNLERIPYREKKFLVKEACMMYKKLKLTDMINSSSLSDAELGLQGKKHLSIFTSILGMLTKDEKEIIIRDFINPDNPQWYVDTYSKSTYYKLKHQAINNFLFLLYA